jgi:hypothetical protein
MDPGSVCVCVSECVCVWVFVCIIDPLIEYARSLLRVFQCVHLMRCFAKRLLATPPCSHACTYVELNGIPNKPHALMVNDRHGQQKASKHRALSRMTIAMSIKRQFQVPLHTARRHARPASRGSASRTADCSLSAFTVPARVRIRVTRLETRRFERPRRWWCV